MHFYSDDLLGNEVTVEGKNCSGTGYFLGKIVGSTSYDFDKDTYTEIIVDTDQGGTADGYKSYLIDTDQELSVIALEELFPIPQFTLSGDDIVISNALFTDSMPGLAKLISLEDKNQFTVYDFPSYDYVTLDDTYTLVRQKLIVCHKHKNSPAFTVIIEYNNTRTGGYDFDFIKTEVVE